MNEYLMTITKGSHFFKINNFDERIKGIIFKFLHKNIRYGLEKIPGSNRYRKVATGIFAAATKDRSEIRIHINQWDDFIRHLGLEFVDLKRVLIQELEPYEPLPLGTILKDEWIDAERDNQKPVIEYLDDETNTQRKFIGMATGFGKGMTCMVGASHYGKRLALVLRPMFIHKWIEDLQKYLKITPEEIMVIQGNAHLKMLLEQQRQGLLSDIKAFIFSNKTLQMWFKEYTEYKEDIRDMGYGITPEELFPFLKIGLRIIDEVHMDFHLNFKIDLFTHVPKAISLSATLENNDPFLMQMYDIAYPIRDRYKSPPPDKYSVARCVLYHIKGAPYVKIKTTEYGAKNYSHNAFEDFIFKNENRLDNYLRLIKYSVDVGFMNDYKPGEKLVIFAFKKEMCTRIVEYLLEWYPRLDIRRYVSEDPPENMYEPVIRVTTLGSGSTAHDIARLKTAIMTVNVESLQANVQAFGRLRKIPDLQTRFYYFICADVDKHMRYHKAKMELLSNRATNFNIIHAPFAV
jgi:superfamily II DNA or RNA helicase